ncbi:hypothetical protein HAX54_001841 [Datura stramonium]|uniref:Uncharacterized protein n=1 Tax=Datura stramonium TaxID=4076 RepID=A0ABS8T3M9_DATST|nr:hypothetical protein [Datura stramonium]
MGATVIGRPSQRDRYHGRRLAIKNRGRNRWFRHNDALTAIASPLQRRYDHCSRQWEALRYIKGTIPFSKPQLEYDKLPIPMEEMMTINTLTTVMMNYEGDRIPEHTKMMNALNGLGSYNYSPK